MAKQEKGLGWVARPRTGTSVRSAVWASAGGAASVPNHWGLAHARGAVQAA